MKRASLFALLASAPLALLSLGTVGCGNLVADRCDAVCDCENCGDREREACEIAADGLYEVADTYGCVDTLEVWLECQLQEHECNNRNYRDDNEGCAREAQEYEECKEAFSTREPGPY